LAIKKVATVPSVKIVCDQVRTLVKAASNITEIAEELKREQMMLYIGSLWGYYSCVDQSVRKSEQACERRRDKMVVIG
jgi:hypothetical protein